MLAHAVMSYLAPSRGESYLDLTAGYGGHAKQVLSKTAGPATLVDRDLAAVNYLRSVFKTNSVEVVHQDFLAASQELNRSNQQFNMILADLGVSSPHLNTASRGFSLMSDGPLDMRMDQRQTLTADIIANTYSERDLTDVLRQYGEEPRAGKIAQAIIGHRPLTSTKELAAAVLTASPRGSQKVHPATRTFQALRIAVNSELDQLAEALPIWIDLLNPSGRLVVISFHSLEDRLVKHALADASIGYEAKVQLLTKKPVIAGSQELVFNPRARSAKLRAVVKINKPPT